MLSLYNSTIHEIDFPQVFNSLTNLSVQSKKPIGNGILTCDNKKQAAKRADPKIKDKGGDAAYAIISVLKIIR